MGPPSFMTQHEKIQTDAVSFYLITCSCHTSLTCPSSRLAALASPRATSSGCEMVPSKETGISANLTFVVPEAKKPSLSIQTSNRQLCGKQWGAVLPRTGQYGGSVCHFLRKK
jgi:hypothetical protein